MGAPAAVAGSAAWAHQTGSISSNGAVVVKSLSGGSTTGTQNPTGAIAKANQLAATQPPTVIIQATSGSTFSYKDDCYIFDGTGSGVDPSGMTRVGMGKVDASNKFTGVVALTAGGGYNVTAAASLFSAGTGASIVSGTNSSTNSTEYVWCGNNASCVWNNLTSGQARAGTTLIGAYSLPVSNLQKCYP